MRRLIKMMNYLTIVVLFIALTGTGVKAMSILPGRSGKVIVPIKEQKAERSIRCKGKVEIDDRGKITKCSEGFYLDEESSNREERKGTLKEKILNWLGNLKGLLFWGTILLVILAPGLLGTIVGRLWEGSRGIAQKALKVTVKAIARAKRNGGEYMKDLDVAHSADNKVQKKINQLRAEVDK